MYFFVPVLLFARNRNCIGHWPVEILFCRHLEARGYASQEKLDRK
jgi:hypothetical protein